MLAAKQLGGVVGTNGATLRPTILLVEDERVISNSLTRLAHPHFATWLAASVADALEAIDGRMRFAGAIIDIGLPDGSGLAVLQALRAGQPDCPALVLTGMVEAAFVNIAHRLRAEYVCKPCFTENVADFLHRLATAPPSDGVTGSRLRSFAASHQLTIRETQILGLAARGFARRKIAELAGLSENTIKSHVRSLLRKTETDRLSRAVWLLQSP